MTPEEQREQVIQNIANLLRDSEFTFEFVAKKKPKGIKIIYEVTQEYLDTMIEKKAENE